MACPIYRYLNLDPGFEFRHERLNAALMAWGVGGILLLPFAVVAAAFLAAHSAVNRRATSWALASSLLAAAGNWVLGQSGY